VGPRSAGASPGPAAYGRGGTEPTVTDANLALGRLDKDNFLGGGMLLDEGAALRAIGGLAAKLRLSELEAAEGIITILNANMANAIRSRTVQKGIDPRDHALVALGGAGPLHGAEVAALLGLTEVIIPPHPGLTSAVGLLTTDLRYDAIRTEFQTEGAVDLAKLNADFADLERTMRAQLAADGIAAEAAVFTRAADLRYVGQGYELRVPLPAGALDDAALKHAWKAFHRQHQMEYGHGFDSPMEIVNIRLTGSGPMPKIGKTAVTGGASLDAARVKTGRGVFRVERELRTLPTAFYRREALPLGLAIPGPAIVLQMDSTTVVPPGATVTPEAGGSLIIRLGSRS
ncbi:MAG: hydantoinase/oxoprolinase family protein, partial [Hyphomicrobiaceae bacterium]|nr:hydantoinase/oxoprolinase family protein [Hyphomicrobiaceae bacterium]